MTKAAALYQFFSSFGIPAFEENSVYDMEQIPEFPYLTYEIQIDSFSEIDTPINFSTWFRSSSWVAANAMTDRISAEIGKSGKVLPCDSGYILIRREHPFAQNMGDDTDDLIKRVNYNISITFYTND